MRMQEEHIATTAAIDGSRNITLFQEGEVIHKFTTLVSCMVGIN